MTIVALASATCCCHGHVIRKAYVPNHERDFDFKRPPCLPAPRPQASGEDVLVRYLGVGGVLIEWKGHTLLTAPFFSNYGIWRVAFGAVQWDDEAIRQGLEGISLDQVSAVLVAHSHYDHLADLPPILMEGATEARVYVNRAGIDMLSAFEPFRERLVPLEDHSGQWIPLTDGDQRMPIRVMPLPSGHAPHLGKLHFAKGEPKEPWEDWDGKRIRKMKEGAVFAFVIDLLDGDLETVRYRIHYQDAAGAPPDGFSSEMSIDGLPVDLAILPMASWTRVEGYPEELLRHTRAGHVLVIHYEDFLRQGTEPLRFVATLTDKRANGFMEQLRISMPPDADRPTGSEPRTCGPGGSAWTMPLPGEWMLFRPRN